MQPEFAEQFARGPGTLARRQAVGQSHLYLVVETVAGGECVAAEHQRAVQHSFGLRQEARTLALQQGVEAVPGLGQGRLCCESVLEFAVGRTQQSGVGGLVGRRGLGNQLGRDAFGFGGGHL